MPSISSVPSIQFTEAGLVIPSESAVLDGVLADMNSAFGGGMNLALETPQGQLASSQAAVISDKNTQFAYIVNQFDPQFADGRFQDAIGRFYFLVRKPATPTTVAVTLTGVAGTVVPAGALSQDTSGNRYALTGAATIGVGGTVSAEVQCLTPGPIACPANTLINVLQAVPGWDAINNPSAGVIGSNVESRADFETRRKNSVALNGRGGLPSIYAAVFDVADVVDVFATENVSDVPLDVGPTEYTLAPHSLYVAAVGGDSSAVATAIWTKKSQGCDYNGNTTVTVTDESGYSYPYPSYAVKFERPAAVAIKFQVTIAANPALPYDIVDQVKAAVISVFTGAAGTGRERIGSNIYASRYYAQISAISPRVVILSVLVGSPTASALQFAVGIDQVPTIDAGDIEVIIS